MGELTKRVLMALWGIPLILGLSYLGGFYFLILVFVINGMALWEYYSMYESRGIHAYRVLGVIFSSTTILLSFRTDIPAIFSLYLLLIVLVLLRHLLLSPPYSSLNTVFTFGGIAYISLFLISFFKLRQNFNDWHGIQDDVYAGGRFIVILWISIWVCDTFAYFGGKLFGKHKLAPNTSPNKTVEGAVSGFVGAILIFVPLGMILLPQIHSLYFWITGIIVGVFGQVGDLVESRFKRDANVKDTSTLLPGHGGFLDRFDSVIYVSPLIYLLFNYVKF